jgi:uncharacterized membrane protein YjjB (DUF3815 family)
MFMYGIESIIGSTSEAASEWKNFGGGTMMRNGIHILSTMMYLKQIEAEARGEKITVKSVMAEMGQISKVKLNDFFVNAFCSFVIAISATIVRKFLLPAASADVMIISSIMSLVPGVAFTTSIRDILNGDYASGSARMLEAIVVALAIAAGVGLGLVSWGVFWRWLT